MLNEDFEDVQGSLPTGWLNSTNPAGDGWVINTSESNNISIYHNDYNGYRVSYLITPEVSLPDSDNVKLTFSQRNEWTSWYEYHGIFISTTTSEVSSFLELQELGVAASEWESIEIDLSSYKGQSIFIAFVYKGDFADEWFIDNVKIEDVVD